MSRALGIRGEDLAEKYLINAGYQILSRNFHTRFGEIDIVAKEGTVISFVEVKFRHDEGYGSAIEFITNSKLHKILKSAKKYLFDNELLENDWRLDAVVIDAKTEEVMILKNIYEEG